MPESQTKPSVPRSQSGVPGFDDVLNGGLISHRLYLVDGDPGAGENDARAAIPAGRREAR